MPAAGRNLAVALALLLARPPDAPAAPVPAIAFDTEACDTGSVVQGEQPACVFGFANAGTAALHVLDVEPTCGCTSAVPAPSTLQPGERGAIRVVFDSENFTGEVVKEVEVRSDDPARPRVTLKVRSLVEPEIEFEPTSATFDAAGAGIPARQLVTVTNRRAEPVRVLSLRAEPGSYRCLLPAWTETARPLTLESWDRAVLEVVFTPPHALLMPVPGECSLEIEGPRKRLFRLKLLALPAQ